MGHENLPTIILDQKEGCLLKADDHGTVIIAGDDKCFFPLDIDLCNMPRLAFDLKPVDIFRAEITIALVQ